MRCILGVLAIAFTVPALAGEIEVKAPETAALDDGRTIETAVAKGFRISSGAGFELVEHGLWAPRMGPQLADSPVTQGRQTGREGAIPSNRAKSSASQFRRASYLPHVYAAEARFSLPAGLLDAVIWTESRYNPIAVSKAGAAGLGQLMPGTAKDLGVTNRFDPYANILGAGRYLRQMLDRFGVVHLALAAYNAGPGAVKRARGIPANRETPLYVMKVLGRWRPRPAHILKSRPRRRTGLLLNPPAQVAAAAG